MLFESHKLINYDGLYVSACFIIPPPDAGADPGINYEGKEGVHKSMNIITKGEGGAQKYSTM